MKALVLARKEITDLRRSRVLLALLGILVASAIVEALVATPNEERSIVASLWSFRRIDQMGLLSLIAILLGALALVEEVESGSIRVTMGFPVSRRDVLIGKLLGRGLIFGVATLVGTTMGGVILVARFGPIPLIEFLQVVGMNLGRGFAYFGFAFGVSAFARTRQYALGLSLGTYVVFLTGIWATYVVGIPYYLFTGNIPQFQELRFPTSDPQWYNFLSWFNPSDVLVIWDNYSGIYTWFLIGVWMFWTIVPVIIGYYRFGKLDISDY